MLKNIYLFIILFFTACGISLAASATDDAPHLRISILTCNPGEELWETFGHTCIRVIDSNRQGGERDVIYNYGFFEASEGNSIGKQFFTGRVSVMLDTITYDELMYEYDVKKRGIAEQVLLLDAATKARLLAYLKDNLSRGKRYYEYDTFFDNCTTRVLRMLEDVLGADFKPGQAIPAGARLSFRDVSINRYCPAQHKYWFGLGLNLFYSTGTDKIMTNRESMFLADYFCEGLKGATYKGNLLCAAPAAIHADNIQWPSSPDWALISMLLLGAVVICCNVFPALAAPAKIVNAIVLIVSGLLGCMMIYMWLMNGEPAWKNNFNILWALPLNIVFPFLGAGRKKRYAIIAIAFIFISLILHIFRVQQMPLSQIWPVLLSFLVIYLVAIKRKLPRN